MLTAKLAIIWLKIVRKLPVLCNKQFECMLIPLLFSSKVCALQMLLKYLRNAIITFLRMEATMFNFGGSVIQAQVVVGERALTKKNR